MTQSPNFARFDPLPVKFGSMSEMYDEKIKFGLYGWNYSCVTKTRHPIVTIISSNDALWYQICRRQWFLKRCMECRHGLAMRILSVRLSVKRVHCDKTEERSVQIFIPYERPFTLVFWESEWLVGATRSTWNFGSTAPPPPIGAKSPILNWYSFVAPQP